MNTISKWLTALGLLVLTFAPTAQAQPPVLQRGYDASVTGANLAETTLNTSNVALKTFGLVFTLPVDDAIFAQPLYVPNVSIPNQGTHNVVYVATMSDTLYAFDADVPGAPLWSVDFASLVGALPVPLAQFVFEGNKNLVGNLGILSTPVIDPSTHILYLVACTLEDGAMVYRLHAVDITTGAEPYGPGVLISGNYGAVTFDARYQVQRVSLALSGQQVVFAFAAVELEGPGVYSGWVMAYDKSTLQQSGAFATETKGNLGGGVWQSGRPPVVDSSGYVYVFSGNAYGNGYDGVNNFSESVLKLDPAHGLKLLDWFTPYDWSDLDDNDFDLSSSGPLLIPGTSELTGGGKTGYLYVLNTANLGKFNAGADTQIIQEEKITSDEMIRGGPVYWQRSAANGGPLLYDWAGNESLKAFAFNGTTFGANPSTESVGTQIPPGGILTLSANGEQSGSGVLWATVATSGDDWNDPPVPGELRAFNAADLSQELWNSSMNWPNNEYGNFAKFVPPLVVNGKVYVATWSTQVAVYGLLPTQQAAPPSFTPAAGVYAKAQSVTLSDSTPGAVIHYTTDGSIPTQSSAKYSVGTPLQISSTTTLQAIALASGYSSSTAATAIYTISGTPVSVAISSVDDVYGIASTGSAPKNGGLDGKGDDYAAALLGTSLSWAGLNFTFGATGTLDAVSNATITLPAGNYTTLNLLGTAVNGSQTAQTFIVTYTDGTTSIFTQSLSDWATSQGYAGETLVLQMPYRITSTGVTDNQPFNLYGYSFALNSAKTVKSLTLPRNLDVVVLAVDLVPTGAPPTPAAAPSFSPPAGSYGSAQSVALSDTTAGATIYYTTNSTTPTTSSARYSPGTPISVSSTTTLEAIATASGYSSSTIATAAYTVTASQGGTPVSVALSGIDDLYGIARTGSAPQGGGIDGRGNDYAAALLGTSLSWSGLNFTFGATGALDAVSHATITLPAGNYATLTLLGTAVNGNQAAQTFIVTYTDGTSSIFTQSQSDWFTPQGYSGETLVLQMAYRISSTGATDNGPFNLYGYSFALNSAKTVQSLTLPSNADVVVLAVDLVQAAGAPTRAAAPTFSPAPGNFGSAQSVTLSDTTPGTVIYYTTNGTTPTTSSAQYSPGTPIPVSTTTTIEAIAAASGYSNSAVASGTYTITQAGAPVSVALTNFTNVDAIANTGTAVQNGGIDGRGNAYAEALLGTLIAWDGATFALGGAGTTDAISATIISLPAGSYSGLSVLGTAVNGDQVDQTFVVTYTDGTTTTLTQSMSDWFTPEGYAGESQAVQMAYRILSTGAVDDAPFNIYGYAFSIDSTKTVKSITLPKNRDVVILALDLTP